MKVLYVSNLSSERCGVKEYGQLWARELRKVGVEVHEWDGCYQAIQAQGGRYLPHGADLFDLIHVNWDPQTINHYLPEHFPPGVPLSVFLHDTPETSTCPFFARADLRMGYVGGRWEGQTVVQIDHAVPQVDLEDWPILPREIREGEQVVVGVSGVRSDPGMAMIKELCKERGWILNAPLWWSGGPWLTMEQEVRRLAMSTFNVCWYHTTGRGKSMAAMFCAASRRPLVVSGSSMFSCLWPYDHEVSICRELPASPIKLADHCDEMVLLIRNKMESKPARLLVELGWDRCAQRIKQLWEGAAR